MRRLGGHRPPVDRIGRDPFLPGFRTGRPGEERRPRGFTFVQISDTHFGFSKEPNKDPAATVLEAVRKVNALPSAPAFVLHTGDITHLAKPAEFDAAAQVLKGLKAEVHYVPGEHDVLSDETKPYLERYGKGTKGFGWRSFDHGGVHFVGLVNVVNLRAS